jgi:hypothetical protein
VIFVIFLKIILVFGFLQRGDLPGVHRTGDQEPLSVRVNMLVHSVIYRTEDQEPLSVRVNILHSVSTELEIRNYFLSG